MVPRANHRPEEEQHMHLHPEQLERFLVDLMRRVREEPYPSKYQMDMIESVLPAEAVGLWLDVLIEKIEQDRFPSVEMMQRVQRLMYA
jgi:hypothetical protein